MTAISNDPKLAPIPRFSEYIVSDFLPLTHLLPDAEGFYTHPKDESLMVSSPHMTHDPQHIITLFHWVNPLNHSLIAKIETFCIRGFNGTEQFLNRPYNVQTIFHKFAGIPLSNLDSKKSRKLSNECVIRLIQDVKVLYLHLFKHSIVCSPLVPAIDASSFVNAMRVTSNGHLKICDYTFWSKVEGDEVTKKTAFMGSIHAPIYKILLCSLFTRENPLSTFNKEETQRQNILASKKLFPHNALVGQDLSSKTMEEIQTALTAAIDASTDEEVADYCGQWIDSIVENFKRENLKAVTFVSLRELCLMHVRFLLTNEDLPMGSDEDGIPVLIEPKPTPTVEATNGN